MRTRLRLTVLVFVLLGPAVEVARAQPSSAPAGRCATPAPPFDPSATPQWNGWGVGMTNTRYQPAGQAGLTAAQVSRLTLKWAFGFPDANEAAAQPTVVGGRLFVGSETGVVYSLDAKTGCIHWTFTAQGEVRTAITVGPRRVSGKGP